MQPTCCRRSSPTRTSRSTKRKRSRATCGSDAADLRTKGRRGCRFRPRSARRWASRNAADASKPEPRAPPTTTSSRRKRSWRQHASSTDWKSTRSTCPRYGKRGLMDRIADGTTSESQWAFSPTSRCASAARRAKSRASSGISWRPTGIRFSGNVVRQHEPALGDDVAPRRVRRADGPRDAGRLALDDDVGRLQALHERRLSGSVSDRRDRAQRVRRRLRAARRV